MDKPLQMIVATDMGGGIGYQGKLPWPKHAGDFKHFKEVTDGSHVIMGRKTYEEIAEINRQRGKVDGPLLPNRTSHVITSKDIGNNNFQITVENSLYDVLKYVKEDNKPVFIIGGLQLYNEALPLVQVIHATVFKEHYTCDRYLPVKYITRSFNIVEGKEESDLYFIKMQRVVD